ncbi:Hypothetical protein NTJ_04572 [Nesidiocoris tenuis]|uniref:Uncharacterized protein n=1 Tax=Nesidiocoris tenuis TaxID=355587 RepID=A0ABN7AHP3_9HEMI|nr:Hypothetical protein NTJ_04572 [Nesidiocoris tenuis]
MLADSGAGKFRGRRLAALRCSPHFLRHSLTQFPRRLDALCPPTFSSPPSTCSCVFLVCPRDGLIKRRKTKENS